MLACAQGKPVFISVGVSAARLHTCMYLRTYTHARTDNTQSCLQGEFMVISDGVSQEGQARQGAHHPGRH